MTCMNRLTLVGLYRLAGCGLLSALPVLAAACGSDLLLPQLVRVEPTVVSLAPGDTLTLRSTGERRSPCPCRWGSSNSAVVVVSSTGLIRALATGSATVTATLERDSDARASALVVVSAP